MGVSAVPGSGKTATIVALATRLIAEGGGTEGGQVLIVTVGRVPSGHNEP